MTDAVRNEGYDDWLDAVERAEAYYVACEHDHGLLPPRRVCPHCGSRELGAVPMPDTGTVLAQTTVNVAAPAFAEDTPYTTAIVAFGDVRVTGQLRETVENGAPVTIDVGETSQGERLVVFEPA